MILGTFMRHLLPEKLECMIYQPFLMSRKNAAARRAPRALLTAKRLAAHTRRRMKKPFSLVVILGAVGLVVGYFLFGKVGSSYVGLGELLA